MPLYVAAETAGHLGAVLAALTVIVLLLLIAVMYVKCRFNVLLWYRNRYGELEINGKLWSAVKEWFALVAAFFNSLGRCWDPLHSGNLAL